MIRTALLPSLLVVAHLLAACQPADPPPGEQTPEQAGTSSTYRLLLNSDGGSGSLYAHEPPRWLRGHTRRLCLFGHIEPTPASVALICTLDRCWYQ